MIIIPILLYDFDNTMIFFPQIKFSPNPNVILLLISFQKLPHGELGRTIFLFPLLYLNLNAIIFNSIDICIVINAEGHEFECDETHYLLNYEL